MRYLICTVACALLPAGIALADTGIYFGGDIGASTEHFDPSLLGTSAHDTGFKITAGIRPISFLAGEVNYVSLGRASGGFDYDDTDGLVVSALAFLPIPVVDVYGRVGVIDYRVDAHEPGYGFHHDGSDLTYGIGAGTHFGNINARVEYERFDISGTSNMSLTTVGVSWNFGWP